MNQQKKSSFVTALAWIFIIFAGFATFISIVQNVMIFFIFPVEEMKTAITESQKNDQIPFFAKFMFSNMRLLFVAFLMLTATTLVSAIALLKRKNWARIVFISIMFLGIGWNISGLIIQNNMFPPGIASPPSEVSAEFSAIMFIMKIFSFVFAVAISYLFAWIIHKLSSKPIKSEFLPIFEINITGKAESSTEIGSKKPKRIIFLSIILTIVIGVYYFGTGNIKTLKDDNNLQQLILDENTNELSSILKEKPHLVNTVINERSTLPIYLAVLNKKTECVRVLIEANADVNMLRSCSMSVLHYAAQDGDMEITDLLLKAGAKPNAIDSDGKTPLDWAIWNNHQDTVGLLRKYGAVSSTELNENKTSKEKRNDIL